MNVNVLNTDLTGKVAVVTGAGGVLCSNFAAVLARAGATVALLDLNEQAAQEFADKINAEGGKAKAYKCNVLDKEICESVALQVESELGSCDILINGAGGNNPRATTDKEYFEIGDIDGDTKSFFDLDSSGVEFVFNLNFLGTLIPTQAFAKQMVGREGCNIINISPSYQNTRIFRCKSGNKQLYTVAGGAFFQSRNKSKRHCSRIFLHKAERPPFVERRRHSHSPHGKDPCRYPYGQIR